MSTFPFVQGEKISFLQANKVLDEMLSNECLGHQLI